MLGVGDRLAVVLGEIVGQSGLIFQDHGDSDLGPVESVTNEIFGSGLDLTRIDVYRFGYVQCGEMSQGLDEFLCFALVGQDITLELPSAILSQIDKPALYGRVSGFFPFFITTSFAIGLSFLDFFRILQKTHQDPLDGARFFNPNDLDEANLIGSHGENLEVDPALRFECDFKGKGDRSDLFSLREVEIGEFMGMGGWKVLCGVGLERLEILVFGGSESFAEDEREQFSIFCIAK
tara:strand:- start:89 stop:793 length:705 start_codon:yes stop_codon:yes gene_type:complete